MADERAKGPGLQFGSSRPTLFSTGCSDPLDYVGAPVPRRARAAHSASIQLKLTAGGSSSSHSSSPDRPRSSAARSPSAPPVRDGMCDDGVGAIALDNMDVHRQFNPKSAHLTSPRSIAACRKLGLTPQDLIIVTYEDCVRRMKEAGEDTSDAEVVRRRHEYLCRRRDQKFEAARLEREAQLHQFGNKRSASAGPVTSSNVVAQERQLQKIMDANSSRLKQQLLHQEVLQRQREKEEENRAAQRRHDELQREQQRLLEMEKTRKEEEAQRLRAEVKQLEKIEAGEAVDAKRQEYEEKDRILRERIDRQRLLAEAKNEAKRQRNAERREAMKEQADAVAKHRRELFQKRWMLFQESQEEFERRREELRQQHAIEADRKRERIERTKQRCDAVLQAKIMRTQQKEQRADEMLRQHEEERAAIQREMAEMEAMKEAQRTQVYKEAQANHRMKVQRLTEKIETSEQHMQRIAELNEAEARLKRERLRESEMDKLDCVERRRRADEHHRRELEAKLEEKSRRVETMKAQQQALSKRHKELREQVERSRVRVEDPTPGPLDYDATQRVTDGPKWRFGLPASVLAARQVSKTHPAPAYEASPGPCMYVPQIRTKTPQFSVCRSERWHRVGETAVTPGPQDYAPATPSVIRSNSRAASPRDAA